MINASNELLKIKLQDAKQALSLAEKAYALELAAANSALREIEIDGIPFVFSSRNAPLWQSINRQSGCIFDRDLPSNVRAIYDRYLEAKLHQEAARECCESLTNALGLNGDRIDSGK